MPAVEQSGIPRVLPGSAPSFRPGMLESERLRAEIEHLRRQLEEAYDLLTRRVNEMLLSGTLANRPAAGVADRIYFASDQASGSRFYYDTGSAWVGQ